MNATVKRHIFLQKFSQTLVLAVRSLLFYGTDEFYLFFSTDRCFVRMVGFPTLFAFRDMCIPR